MRHWKLLLRLALALALFAFAMAEAPEPAAATGLCSEICPPLGPQNICSNTVYCLCNPHGTCGAITSCAACLCS